MSVGGSRQIAQSIWDDPWFSRQTERIQRLYLYLLTNRYTNIAGVYEETAEQVRFHLRLEPKELEESMAYLAEQGKTYRCGDYIIMRNWPRHQATKSKDVLAGINRILMGLPLEVLQELERVGYRYDGLGTIIMARGDGHRPSIDPPPTIHRGSGTLPNPTLPNSTLRDEASKQALAGIREATPKGAAALLGAAFPELKEAAMGLAEYAGIDQTGDEF